MATTLEKSVEEMMSYIDKKYFFRVLKNSSMCQAKCCEMAGNRVQLQSCMSQCNQPVEKVQVEMDAQLKDFQDRLQRCVMRCQDQSRESLPVSPSQDQIQRAQEQIAKCADGCAKEFEKKIPRLQAEIESKIKGSI